jgi:hypothetical protein
MPIDLALFMGVVIWLIAFLAMMLDLFLIFRKPLKERIVYSEDVEAALKEEREAISKLLCPYCRDNDPISNDDSDYHVLEGAQDRYHTGKYLQQCKAAEVRARNNQ